MGWGIKRVWPMFSPVLADVGVLILLSGGDAKIVLIFTVQYSQSDRQNSGFYYYHNNYMGIISLKG